MCTNFYGFNFHREACSQKLVSNENFCVYGRYWCVKYVYGGIMDYLPKTVKPNLFYDVSGKEKRARSDFMSEIVP